MEVIYRCNVHFVHLTGTRMIRQGKDGMSRGDIFEGVIKWKLMMSVVSLHKVDIEVLPTVI